MTLPQILARFGAAVITLFAFAALIGAHSAVPSTGPAGALDAAFNSMPLMTTLTVAALALIARGLPRIA